MSYPAGTKKAVLTLLSALVTSTVTADRWLESAAAMLLAVAMSWTRRSPGKYQHQTRAKGNYPFSGLHSCSRMS